MRLLLCLALTANISWVLCKPLTDPNTQTVKAHMDLAAAGVHDMEARTNVARAGTRDIEARLTNTEAFSLLTAAGIHVQTIYRFIEFEHYKPMWAATKKAGKKLWSLAYYMRTTEADARRVGTPGLEEGRHRISEATEIKLDPIPEEQNGDGGPGFINLIPHDGGRPEDNVNMKKLKKAAKEVAVMSKTGTKPHQVEFLVGLYTFYASDPESDTDNDGLNPKEMKNHNSAYKNTQKVKKASAKPAHEDPDNDGYVADDETEKKRSQRGPFETALV
ncbi:Uu.00g139250.m01.CDS01 [Anthostomella pinea]|uniref:Uu.00g139250.m01.CDS01 n=1 Tax=Anthostomella pinea TaxID=933095 RepID=A0AAI8YLA6_9PEZI|nr:Uu.00g139250.m01.CDS01 [Anthostomella pinea]